MKQYLLFVILIVCSAFFSGSETAFFSLSKVRLEKFKKKNRKALGIEDLKEKPDYLLASILLGNMFVNIAFASSVAALFIGFSGKYGIFLSIAASSLIILIFGEILPKMIAINTAEKFALISSYVLRIFNMIVFPLCWLVIGISKNLFKWIFRRDIRQENILTEQELKEALEVGKTQGIIDEEEEDMIHLILEFSDKEASEIMTPRIDVKAIDIEEIPDKIYETLRQFKHSYVPVFRENIDDIVGVLRTKDYFLDEEKSLEKLLRGPVFVPETKNIGDLMKELLSKKEKMALVVDEHGGFSGIVTQEDVQEEVFGEVYDEYETPKKTIEKVSKKEFIVDAGVSVKDVNYELDLNLPEEEDTLGGFILSIIERFPQEKEVISFKGMKFIVEKATKRRILRLRIKLK
ncbi:MAG: HlyC/CorC family transporter [Candidatus Omnitrophica bacterium]|nr:HlyC/CorC family transporter [Candidatus Omnitrophota bacterium]